MDSDQDKCQLFSEYFSSVFTVEDCTSIPQLPDNCCSPLTTIAITPQMVFDKLTQLTPPKPLAQRAGHFFVLKNVHKTYKSILFNKSLESSELPDRRKEALVTPAL